MTIDQQNELNAEIRHQDWGRDRPIPELEALLVALNKERGRFASVTGSRRTEWDQIRSKFFGKARRLLGVKAAEFRGDSLWNNTINALTLYRADWRGYTVSNSRGGAL